MIRHFLRLLSIALLLTSGRTQSSNQVCLLVPPEVNDCYRSFQNKDISATAVQVTCLQKLLWNYVPDTSLRPQDTGMVNVMGGTIQNTAGRLTATPSSGFRQRSEYRTLTNDQRRRFHNAMNRLYENGTIGVFTRIHANAVANHHSGASFLSFHRVYLTEFEERLRIIDPSVSLPYLDTSIDDAMDNPVNSVLWSPEYLGNGAGAVTTGPFAGWVTDQGALERDYGKTSNMFKKSDLNNVLTRCRLEEISRPTANPMYNFEDFHGGPHVWIGGDMAFGRTTGWDPAFYLHHAFVDYIWEEFRKRQMSSSCRVDPTRDYPTSASGTHAIDAQMTGFPSFTNRDGLSNLWTRDIYNYNPAPSCPDCCPGCSNPAPMFCDDVRQVCVATSRRTLPITGAALTATADRNAEFVGRLDNDVLENPLVPRNRGRMFDHPPNDGRTLETALSDAMNFSSNTDNGVQLTTRTVGNTAFSARGRARTSVNGFSRRPIDFSSGFRSGRTRTDRFNRPRPRSTNWRFPAPARQDLRGIRRWF